MYKIGQTVIHEFATANASQVLTTASTIAGKLYCGSTVTAVPVFISAKATGLMYFVTSLPTATFAAGDCATVFISAKIGGVSHVGNAVWSSVIDSYRTSDVYSHTAAQSQVTAVLAHLQSSAYGLQAIMSAATGTQSTTGAILAHILSSGYGLAAIMNATARQSAANAILAAMAQQSTASNIRSLLLSTGYGLQAIWSAMAKQVTTSATNAALLGLTNNLIGATGSVIASAVNSASYFKVNLGALPDLRGNVVVFRTGANSPQCRWIVQYASDFLTCWPGFLSTPVGGNAFSVLNKGAAPVYVGT